MVESNRSGLRALVRNSFAQFRQIESWRARFLWASAEVARRGFSIFHPDLLYSAPGFRIYLHYRPHMVSGVIVLRGTHEPLTSRWLSTTVRPGNVVVDVGANIGWYTLMAASKGAHVWAFEPDPENFALLQRSIAKNGFRNIRAEPVAISDHAGQVSLWCSDLSAGFHSLVRSAGNRPIEVEACTLDARFPTETIDLLKVDVEGGEPEVLFGATRLLREGRIRWIVMEWNPEAWTKSMDFLEQFEAQQVDGTPLALPPPRKLLEHNLLLRPVAHGRASREDPAAS